MDSVTLKNRSDLHLARKLWHVLGVLAMVAVFLRVTHDEALQLIAVVAFFAVGLDISRQLWPPLNRIVLKVIGPLMRTHERHGLAGTTYLTLGTFIIVWFFPKPIVVLTLLFLAVADPLASFVGLRYGKDKLVGQKSLQGTLAAFLACTVIAAGYFHWNGIMSERLLIASLFAGLVGALSELIPLGRMDDNLSFPLLCAAALWLLFRLFGGPL